MSQSRGPDPFESPSDVSPSDVSPSAGGAAATSAIQSGLREPFVLQAVKFLSDPRVQAADPSRAVEFLLGKTLTENEVRAAFNRLSLPYPHAHISTAPDGSFPDTGLPPNVVMLPPGARLHVDPPTRSTWSSWLWNATVIIGIIGTLREIFRRYIVPNYLPELRLSEGSRHWQSTEIGELRQAVQQLTESSRETSQRVERLSITLSSTGALEEGNGVSSSRRHEAEFGRSSLSGITSFQHESSVADSDRSRGVLERLDELRDEVNSLKLLSSGQKSAAGYSQESSLKNVDEFYTPQQHGHSLDQAMSERPRLGSRDERLSFGTPSEKSRRSVSFKSERPDISPADSGDDFMSMAPASVEESWASDALRSAEKASSSAATPGDALSSSSERTSSHAKDMMANSDSSSLVQEHSNDLEKTGAPDSNSPAIGREDTAETEARGEVATSSDPVSAEPDSANAALERFRETMRVEAELVASGEAHEVTTAGASDNADAAIGMDFALDDLGLSSKRLSTASAPAPDTALSDVD